MKKWLGMICSAVAGIFTFVFMALKTFTFDVPGDKKSYNAYEILQNKEDMFSSALKEWKGYGLYKAFAIIMMIVAVLLILWAVVMLLKNLGVLKFNLNVNLVNTILLALLVVVAIVALIALFVMGGDVKDFTSSIVEGVVGVGAWLNLVVPVLACAGGTTALLMRKGK